MRRQRWQARSLSESIDFPDSNSYPPIETVPVDRAADPRDVSKRRMCHFLTISIPEKNVPEVPENFRRKIHFIEHSNGSVTKHAPPDWTSFAAISGGCSCDFYRAPQDAPDTRSKREQKYRKKGWSNAKIRRALDSQEDAPTRAAGLRDDILDLVSDLTNAFGEIRLSLHWYSGDIETENFNLSDVGVVSLDDFRRDTTALRDETTLTVSQGQTNIQAK